LIDHVRQANGAPVFVAGREQRARGPADDVQVQGRGEAERGERPSRQVKHTCTCVCVCDEFEARDFKRQKMLKYVHTYAVKYAVKIGEIRKNKIN